MRDVHGWRLPDCDSYFDRFVTGPGEAGGFQVDHLEAAFPFVAGWDVALDVGAHIGFWSVPMAGRFKAVHAFEMAPDTYACLKRNCEPYANVSTYHVGVGEKRGSCEMREDPSRQGNTGSRFIGAGGSTMMVAIDDFDWAACDLMKVDVEGYEFQALTGARKTIERFRPVIVMETDKRFAKARYGVDDDAAERFLLDMGYRVAEHMRPDKVFVP